jgi:hypothetical protein
MIPQMGLDAGSPLLIPDAGRVMRRMTVRRQWHWDKGAGLQHAHIARTRARAVRAQALSHAHSRSRAPSLMLGQRSWSASIRNTCASARMHPRHIHAPCMLSRRACVGAWKWLEGGRDGDRDILHIIRDQELQSETLILLTRARLRRFDRAAGLPRSWLGAAQGAHHRSS